MLGCVLKARKQQDYPFYIRIPESIPPSLALEKGGSSYSYTRMFVVPDCRTAGVKYELVAQLCVKGKK
jgi:hypothetical protein